MGNLNELLTSKELETNALKGELTHLESLSRGRSRASADTADSGLGEFKGGFTTYSVTHRFNFIGHCNFFRLGSFTSDFRVRLSMKEAELNSKLQKYGSLGKLREREFYALMHATFHVTVGPSVAIHFAY